MVQNGISENSKTSLEIIIHYLSILWRHRLFIVIATCGVTLAVIVVCFLSIIMPPDKSPMPNVYKAEATILVQENNQTDIASSIMSALGATQSSPSSVRDNGEIIIEIINSRMLLDALVEEFDIVGKYNLTTNAKGVSRELMRNKIQYSYNNMSGILKVSSQDTNPVQAKNVVNKTVSLLETWFSQNRGLAKQKLRQSLEDKITEVKTGIDSLQNRLKSLQKQYGVLNVEELGETQASSLANLRSQLILKDVEIKNYTSFSKIDDPRLEQLKEERQNLLDLIEQNQQKLPEAQPSSGPRGTQKSLPDVAQEFSQLTLELDIQQKIYNTLSPQYEAAKLSPESEPIFQVIELADVPDMKSGPRRWKFVAVGFAASFFGSILISLLHSAMQKLNLKKIKDMIVYGG
jgi:tyrosine-protein kinase Etk/Wzc